MGRWRLGSSLWLIGIAISLFLVYLPAAGAGQTQQTFNAAATVTALVQTRTAILAILTGTPQAPAVTNGQASAGTTDAPTATVKVRGLNVRSGPGTNYPVVANVNAGQALVIVGSAVNCSWLKVQDGGRELGWISGSSQYVTVTTPCSGLPVETPTPTASAADNGATDA
jgi:uncharacterized protein YgiM (DUF1202 family)